MSSIDGLDHLHRHAAAVLELELWCSGRHANQLGSRQLCVAATLQLALLLVDASVACCKAVCVLFSGQLPGWHVARLMTRVLICDGVFLLKLGVSWLLTDCSNCLSGAVTTVLTRSARCSPSTLIKSQNSMWLSSLRCRVDVDLNAVTSDSCGTMGLLSIVRRVCFAPMHPFLFPSGLFECAASVYVTTRLCVFETLLP